MANLLEHLLVHDIRLSPPEIIDLAEPILTVGMAVKTSIRTVYRDVPRLGKAFNRAKRAWAIPDRRLPWGFVAVSEDHDVEAGSFVYLMGEIVTRIGDLPEGWLRCVIPASKYAVFTIRPKRQFAWPLAIGSAKRYIFLEWLPASGYDAGGEIDDFEYHDERSLRKRDPSIDLYVAIRARA